MQLEVKPAVFTFAASAFIVGSIAFSTPQPNSISVEDNRTTESAGATAMLGGATVTASSIAPMPQGYYWTDAWQREEAQSLKEFADGDFLEFDDVEDLLSWLDEPEA